MENFQAIEGKESGQIDQQLVTTEMANFVTGQRWIRQKQDRELWQVKQWSVCLWMGSDWVGAIQRCSEGQLKRSDQKQRTGLGGHVNGDERVAQAIAKQLGIEHRHCWCPSSRKTSAIQNCKKQVPLFGDGINDAPMLDRRCGDQLWDLERMCDRVRWHRYTQNDLLGWSGTEKRTKTRCA